MHQKSQQTGRSLVETLAVLAIIAILTIAGLLGYSFVLKKQQEKQTVKQVAEVGVRYNLNRVKPRETDNRVLLKTVYPEAERQDAVTMITADQGRVSLKVEEDTTAFSVEVNNVTDNSCREILASGAYDALLYDIGEGKPVTIGSEELKNWNLSETDEEKIAELKGLSKEEIIDGICDNQRTNGHFMALIWGGDCPKNGTRYWYQGKCWHCPENLTEDTAGNCCENTQIDACGYCPGKCPNGGYCRSTKEPHICVECLEKIHCEKRSDNKHECDPDDNVCVECVVPGSVCKTSDGKDGRCKSNHVCEPCDEATTPSGSAKSLFRWNGTSEVCECNGELGLGESCLVVGGIDCCKESFSCQKVGGKSVCTECVGDYNSGSSKDCPQDAPLCKNETGSDGKTCYECPEATEEGDTCSSHSACGCTNGLICSSENKCQCPAGQSWLEEQCCVPSEKNPTKCKKTCPADAQTGCNCDDVTGKWYDNTATENWSNGHCCPAGQSWLENQCCIPSETDATKCKKTCDANAQTACSCNDATGKWYDKATEHWSNGHCCDAGLEWLDGGCCVPSESDPTRCSCPTEAPYPFNGRCLQCKPNTNEGCTDTTLPWCKSATETSKECVECLEDAHCAGRSDTKTSCNTETSRCECPSGTFWNQTAGRCTACLLHYGENGEGACSSGHPKCDKSGSWTCGDCPEGLPWNAEKHECECPSGTYWNDTTKTCTVCLVDRGHGTGACPTVSLPVCNTTSWICEPCPTGLTWDDNAKMCVENPYTPDKPVYESPNTCCKSGGCACCGGTCAKKKTVKLYPGYYEVIVIGAGGGGAGDANGHHSTNYGMGGTGGSGGSFKGTLKITATESVTVTTGAGGYAVSSGGTGGTGGASAISGIVSCPGGGGAYAGGRHSSSSGAGGAKCSVKRASSFTKINTNKAGSSGSSTYCKHTGCSKSIGGSSPAIKVKNNYGGSCGGTVAFKSSRRYTPSGNCGYIKITYKKAL